jgi:hypothetical protein
VIILYHKGSGLSIGFLNFLAGEEASTSVAPNHYVFVPIGFLYSAEGCFVETASLEFVVLITGIIKVVKAVNYALDCYFKMYLGVGHGDYLSFFLYTL